MKKKPTKGMVIISIIIVVIALVSLNLLISYINYEKRNRNNDSYVDYVYRDSRLVCLEDGENVGKQTIEIDYVDHVYYYNLIKGVSDEEFIAAEVRTFFSPIDYLVLQSPDNDTDVLEDWKIKEIELFYYDINENLIKTLKKKVATRDGDYIIHTIANSSDMVIIEEFLDALLNSSPDMSFNKSEERDSYRELISSTTDFYLRIHFEETESIVWDTYIFVYRNITDASEYVITLGYSTKGGENERKSYEVQIDSSSELYKMILEAYQEHITKYR